MGFNLEDYEPVQARIGRFWDDHATHGFITTELAATPADGNSWVVKATVGERHVFETSPDITVVLATGYAEEIPGQGNVNKTSALENCETSAIGRALANAGYTPSVSARASREEMANADQHRNDMDDATERAKKLAAGLGPDADEHWKAWKQEHDAWHRTLPGLQDAVVELERIVTHFDSVGAVEPPSLPAETTSEVIGSSVADPQVVPAPTSSPVAELRDRISPKSGEDTPEPADVVRKAKQASLGADPAGSPVFGDPEGSGAVRTNRTASGIRADGKKRRT